MGSRPSIWGLWGSNSKAKQEEEVDLDKQFKTKDRNKVKSIHKYCINYFYNKIIIFQMLVNLRKLITFNDPITKTH